MPMFYKTRARFFWWRMRFWWYLRRRPRFNPFSYKAAVLIAYQHETGIDTCIETGTAMADTTEAIAPWFKVVHTIDMDKSLHRNVKAKLSCYPHVVCHDGDSAKIFPMLMYEQDTPAILWIDAHGPIEEFRGEPLLTELKVMSWYVDRKHHIFIDDADSYVARYPTEFSDWRKFMEVSGYRVQLRDNIWRASPV